VIFGSAPPLPLEPTIAELYEQVNTYWARELLHSPETMPDRTGLLDEVVLVSVGGSHRDHLVDSGLVSVSSFLPAEHGFTVLTPSMPGVWLEADHQCILWCNQLVRSVSHALEALVHPSTHRDSGSLQYRVALLGSYLRGALLPALHLGARRPEEFARTLAFERSAQLSRRETGRLESTLQNPHRTHRSEARAPSLLRVHSPSSAPAHVVLDVREEENTGPQHEQRHHRDHLMVALRFDAVPKAYLRVRERGSGNLTAPQRTALVGLSHQLVALPSTEHG
jgi:PGAP1-like protein